MKQVTIGGIKYDALFNLRATKTYYDITGEDITQVSKVSDTGALIYACIDAAFRYKKQPTSITLDEVYDLVDIFEIEGIIKAIIPQAKGE